MSKPHNFSAHRHGTGCPDNRFNVKLYRMVNWACETCDPLALLNLKCWAVAGLQAKEGSGVAAYICHQYHQSSVLASVTDCRVTSILSCHRVKDFSMHRQTSDRQTGTQSWQKIAAFPVKRDADPCQDCVPGWQSLVCLCMQQSFLTGKGDSPRWT